ncbi:MAG TPA: GDYXXLXY domain-containing protein [bacterium]|nr:GDYXXLXY domain-containing protein [bacterium]HOM25892.1 GDYXXLXY domain-containing protein [bacterium]
MNKKTIKFFIVIFIHILILTGVALYYKWTKKGITVFLKIGRYDPMSPLRGDYLTLFYPEISRIPFTEFASSVSIGDTFYVPLEKKDKIWIRKKDVKIDKRKEYEGIFIKGMVKNVGSYVILEYGIETYYIPVGTGEDIKWSDNDYAEIFIDENGNGKIKKIYLNGKQFP